VSSSSSTASDESRARALRSVSAAGALARIATFDTSAGRERKAIPSPDASRSGKTKVQKTASGSR
jgi:hypothetical protein